MNLRDDILSLAKGLAVFVVKNFKPYKSYKEIKEVASLYSKAFKEYTLNTS